MSGEERQPGTQKPPAGSSTASQSLARGGPIVQFRIPGGLTPKYRKRLMPVASDRAAGGCLGSSRVGVWWGCWWLGAGGGLWFAGGVFGPVLVGGRAGVGAERGVGVGEQGDVPQVDGAAGGGCGQPGAVGAGRGPVHDVEGAGGRGRAGWLAGGGVP